MNDFVSLEKLIVRDLSCRLCLCNDVGKLKPLSEELKRKIKKLFNVSVRGDDNLPKAICHECLHQVSTMYLYTVKVDKTQKFLSFHKLKVQEERKAIEQQENQRILQHPNIPAEKEVKTKSPKSPTKERKEHFDLPSEQQQQGDTKQQNDDTKKTKKARSIKKKSSATELKYMESMTLDEFANSEKVDKSLLDSSKTRHKSAEKKHAPVKTEAKKEPKSAEPEEYTQELLDPLVLVDGRPARQGAALDRQITLFYKMECCICHEKGFNFKSLMKHYKDRHGVPGYVTCCDKKFHYFYPRKIIEHMAYHLQPNIFMCPSCHQNFQNSQELKEHQVNGGESEGKILCARCPKKFPTYRELGRHIITHRTDKTSCDICGKPLKHHHRKKTVNHMENVILCSQCLRSMRSAEKHEKEAKEKNRTNRNRDMTVLQRRQKFHESLDMSATEDSTD